MSDASSRKRLITVGVLVVCLGALAGGVWYVTSASGLPSKKEADAAAREAKLIQESLKDAPPPPAPEIEPPAEPIKGRGPMVKPK
jgi:hypothetical protein